MKNIIVTTLVAVGMASLACGCNKTESTPSPSNTNASTAVSTAAPIAAPITAPAVAPAAAPTPAPAPATAIETVKSAATDLATKFVAQAKTAADSQLAPIASELAGKMQALTAAVSSSDAIKSKLESVLQSLISGQDATALGSAFEMAKIAEAAKFTPQQLTLAKEVGNLASAFVVQKNFSALEGAQSDVATIVSSLRSGQLSAAVPALKNVATNAHLTEDQKKLITTVADKYAPGWKKAAEALDTLKKLPSF